MTSSADAHESSTSAVTVFLEQVGSAHARDLALAGQFRQLSRKLQERNVQSLKQLQRLCSNDWDELDAPMPVEHAVRESLRLVGPQGVGKGGAGPVSEASLAASLSTACGSTTSARRKSNAEKSTTGAGGGSDSSEDEDEDEGDSDWVELRRCDARRSGEAGGEAAADSFAAEQLVQGFRAVDVPDNVDDIFCTVLAVGFLTPERANFWHLEYAHVKGQYGHAGDGEAAKMACYGVLVRACKEAGRPDRATLAGRVPPEMARQLLLVFRVLNDGDDNRFQLKRDGIIFLALATVAALLATFLVGS